MDRRIRPLLLLVVTLTGSLLASGCLAPGPAAQAAASAGPHGGDAPLVVALPPSAEPEALAPVAQRLERALRDGLSRAGEARDVRVVVPRTQAEVVAGMRDGTVDAALMKPWPALHAQRAAAAQVVLAMEHETSVGGARRAMSYTYSHYVVPIDAPAHDLAHLRGERVAYTTPDSLEGYVFPVAHLVQRQLVPAGGLRPAEPGAHFGAVAFAGSEARAYRALREGRADAAVLSSDFIASPEVAREVRIVATQGPVPTDVVAFAPHLRGPERGALRAAFLDLRGDEREAVRDLGYPGYLALRETTGPEHLNPLTLALRQAGLREDRAP